MKANELLHRRLTVEDAAEAHIVALERAPEIGFGTFIVSAPTPFERSEAAALKRDAAAVIARHFPDAPALYAARVAACRPASAASTTAAPSACWASAAAPISPACWTRCAGRAAALRA